MSDKSSPLSIVTNGAVLYFIGKVMSNGLAFSLQLLITRSLGAGSFGVFSYARTILQIVNAFARLGVTESIMKFVPAFQHDGRTRGRYITLAFVTSIGGSVIASALLFYFADIISVLTLDNSRLGDLLKIFSILLPLQVFTQATANTFRAFEMAREQVFINDALVPILNVVSIGVAIILGSSIVGVAAAFSFAGLLAALIGLIILYNLIDINLNLDLDKSELYEYYNFSIPLTLTTAGALLYTQVDRLMIGYFLGDVEVGVYTIAIGLATTVGLALSGLNQLFPPIASELHSQNNHTELRELFQATTRWSLTICLLPALLLYIHRYEVLGLFGPEFQSGSLVLTLFILGQITRSAVGPSGYMLMMTDHQYVVLFNRWLLGISNVVANYVFILKYGLSGAAIASALTLALVNILRLFELWFLEQHNPYTNRFIKPIFASLIVFAVVSIVHSNLLSTTLPNIFVIVFGCVSGLVVYSFCLYVFGIDEVDRQVYSELRG